MDKIRTPEEQEQFDKVSAEIEENQSTTFTKAMKEYIEYIQLEMGYPVVKLELNETQIEKIVISAFNELKHYITDTRTMTLPFQNKIDVSDKKIASVVYVMRGQSPNVISPIQDVMYVYTRQGGYSNYALTDYARALLAQQAKNAIATDLDFYYDKPNKDLYIHCNHAVPATVSIEYIPEYEKVDDIFEPFWMNLLKRLSLAMTKQILGRIRGKYTLNTAHYNLDADTLLSEANAELQEIRQYLNSNSDMLLPID